MSDAPRLRRRIERLERKRQGLLQRLMKPRQMVAGSVYKTHRRCGKPSCRCARGELHGPFTVLSTAERGRRSVIHIRKRDEDWVSARALEYRQYQKQLVQLKETDLDIHAALKELRDGYLRKYS